MITFSSGGRLGNQLFQYVFARLLADHIGYRLDTTYAWNDTITATPHRRGAEYNCDMSTILETKNIDNLFLRQYERRHYHIVGYWQMAAYYIPYRKKILQYFNEKAPLRTNRKDIIMHVRLDDYKDFGKGGTVLGTDYYHECINRGTFDKLYVVTDAPDDEYFRSFAKYKPIFPKGSERDDFWFMTQFDRIICGNSTFSWWAAFLSNAGTVYLPSCWIRNSHDIRHDLTRVDGSRSIEVKADFHLKV